MIAVLLKGYVFLWSASVSLRVLLTPLFDNFFSKEKNGPRNQPFQILSTKAFLGEDRTTTTTSYSFKIRRALSKTLNTLKD